MENLQKSPKVSKISENLENFKKSVNFKINIRKIGMSKKTDNKSQIKLPLNFRKIPKLDFYYKNEIIGIRSSKVPKIEKNVILKSFNIITKISIFSD